MTEFIAQLLWVAIGDYYESLWPLNEHTFPTLCAAQDHLGKIWGWV